MANRLILNETSYHGKGAIQHIVHEVKSRSFTKALIVTDKDLVRYQVVAKVTNLLDEAGLPYEIFDEVKTNPAVCVIKKKG
ncbi:iron-containing alcohol dehydrogenase [Glaesserella parasuis]|nr:iron-containing alcohol dehydrogenase [Glaesserella parasuis]MDG6480055.1 iron-containing alcohol dehydrogenase [Glaesserella parasuis]